MKKFLVLFLLLGTAAARAQPVNVPSGPPVTCNASAIYSASTSGSTQLVALATGKIIYVCGYVIQGGSTVNVKLTTGTGSACATGATDLTPLYILVAQSVVQDVAAFFRGMLTPVSQALCVNTSGAVAANVIVYYGQY